VSGPPAVIAAGRKRFPKGTKTKRLPARVTLEVYRFVVAMCGIRDQEMSLTVDQMMRELAKLVHVEL
jgi:hypothetical protein